MKKLSFIALLCAFVLCSCTKDNVDDNTSDSGYGASLPDLIVGFADDYATKIFIEQDQYLLWHEGDLVTAFYGDTVNRQYKFNGATGDDSGKLSHVPSGDLQTDNTLGCIYSVYPYNENIGITEEGVISLTMPAVQQYAENSFGKGANTMLAVTESVDDHFLAFKNAGGYLQLKLYGDDVTVKSIEIRGNNDEKIAGAATATMTYGGVPNIVMSDDAATSVVLDCGDGVELSSDIENPTAFWFVLPVTEFSEGITIKVTNTKNGVFEQSTSNVIPIERNIIQPMTALKVECSISSYELWYTSSDGEAVTPYNSDAFGAAIVSNEYKDGKGVITFDGDITSIGQYAFYCCSSLTSVTIPDSVTSIGEKAFLGCVSLPVENNIRYAGNYAVGVTNKELTSYTLKEGTRFIGSGAFYGCTSLTNITIPDSVTKIGELAFRYCSSLTSITIPDSVTEIREYAFEGCSSLTSVTIPDSVTEIGKEAFAYCSSLTSVTIGNSVTEIRDYTFYGCSSLTNVTIPDSVTEIGNYAFQYCSSLTNVTIPDSVTEIGSSAFYGCSSLESFYGKFASSDNRCLIVDGVLNSFAPANLTSYTIPDSVTSIGSSAFSFCSSLTSVTIPDSVTKIGNRAFDGCSSLTSVTIPDSVTEIGEWAFSGCSSLKIVTIPSSVTSIGDRAFFKCTSLNEVYCNKQTPARLGASVFDADTPIYVPVPLLNIYKAAEGWKDYAANIYGYFGAVAP